MLKETSNSFAGGVKEKSTHFKTPLPEPISPITTPHASPDKVIATNQKDEFLTVKGSKQKEKLAKRNEKRRQEKLNEKVDIKMHVCSTHNRCKSDRHMSYWLIMTGTSKISQARI